MNVAMVLILVLAIIQLGMIQITRFMVKEIDKQASQLKDIQARLAGLEFMSSTQKK